MQRVVQLISKPVLQIVKNPVNMKGCARQCPPPPPPKIAVILAGCGVQDGSEIHEAVSVLSHLTRNGIDVRCFAPDINQSDVIDHSTGKPDKKGCRNVLIESARIARGNICPLKALAANHDQFKALIIPGGFGVAKNLCDFAAKGQCMKVDEDVSCAITTFHKAKKPIGFICIAPVLAAKLIPNVTITLGKSCGDEWPYKDAIQVAKEMGARTEEKGVSEFSFDECNNVYSTPAYMYDGAFHEIDDGIGCMVTQLTKNLC